MKISCWHASAAASCRRIIVCRCARFDRILLLGSTVQISAWSGETTNTRWGVLTTRPTLLAPAAAGINHVPHLLAYLPLALCRRILQCQLWHQGWLPLRID